MNNLDLKKAFDNIFWDLSEGSNISKIIKIIQKGVYDIVYQELNDFYKNLFVHLAKNLYLYSEIFQVSNRTSLFGDVFRDFEVYRMKIAGLWFASFLMPVLNGLNYLVGGFSAQPVFIDRINDVFEMSWWLGVYENNLPKGSFLDGAIPGAYNEPRTWLRSIYTVATGIKIHTFFENNDLLGNTEEREEFEEWLHKLYMPVELYIEYHNFRENPPDYYLWGLGELGYGGSLILEKMQIRKIFCELTDDAIGSTAVIETQFRTVENGLYEFAIFDIIFSDILERKIFVDIGGGWRSIIPWELIFIETGQVRFKIEIKNIRQRINYRFISMMLRRR